MNKYFFIIFIATFMTTGCAVQKPQLSFIPVESSKYPTPEALQKAVAMASKACRSASVSKTYDSGINAVSGIRNDIEEAAGVNYEVCMVELGFIQP